MVSTFEFVAVTDPHAAEQRIATVSIGACARRQAVANAANSTRPTPVTAMAVVILTFRKIMTSPIVK